MNHYENREPRHGRKSRGINIETFNSRTYVRTYVCIVASSMASMASMLYRYFKVPTVPLISLALNYHAQIRPRTAAFEYSEFKAACQFASRVI